MCAHITHKDISMNITLSADKKIVEKARKYAQKQNTTLNSLVRDYLLRITLYQDKNESAEEFEQIALKNGGKSSADYVFDRSEIYNMDEN